MPEKKSLLYKILEFLFKKLGIWRTNTIVSALVLIWSLLRLYQGDEFYAPIVIIVSAIFGYSAFCYAIKGKS